MPFPGLPRLDIIEDLPPSRVANSELQHMESLSPDSIDVFESLVRENDDGTMRRPTSKEHDDRIHELRAQGITGLHTLDEIRDDMDKRTLAEKVEGGAMSFLKSAVGVTPSTIVNKLGGPIRRLLFDDDIRGQLKDRGFTESEIESLTGQVTQQVEDEQVIRLERLQNEADKHTSLFGEGGPSLFDAAGTAAGIAAGGAVAFRSVRAAGGLGKMFGLKDVVGAGIKSTAAQTLARETVGNFGDAVFNAFKNTGGVAPDAVFDELASNMIASGALKAIGGTVKGIARITTGHDKQIIKNLFENSESGRRIRKQLQGVKEVARDMDATAKEIIDSTATARIFKNKANKGKEAATLIASDAGKDLTPRDLSGGFEALLRDERIAATHKIDDMVRDLTEVQAKGAPNAIPVQKRVMSKIQSLLNKRPGSVKELGDEAGIKTILSDIGDDIIKMSRANGVKVSKTATPANFKKAELTVSQLEEIRGKLNQALKGIPPGQITKTLGEVNASIVDRLKRAEIVGRRRVKQGSTGGPRDRSVPVKTDTEKFIAMKGRLLDSKITDIKPDDLEGIASLRHTDFRESIEGFDDVVNEISGGEMSGFLELASRLGTVSAVSRGGAIRRGIGVGSASRTAVSPGVVSRIMTSVYALGSPVNVRNAARLLGMQEKLFKELPFITKIMAISTLQESDLFGGVTNTPGVTKKKQIRDLQDRDDKLDVKARILNQIERDSKRPKLSERGRRVKSKSNTKKLREALKRRQNR